MPAKAGIQFRCVFQQEKLDSRLRGPDGIFSLGSLPQIQIPGAEIPNEQTGRSIRRRIAHARRRRKQCVLIPHHAEEGLGIRQRGNIDHARPWGASGAHDRQYLPRAHEGLHMITAHDPKSAVGIGQRKTELPHSSVSFEPKGIRLARRGGLAMSVDESECDYESEAGTKLEMARRTFDTMEARRLNIRSQLLAVALNC